VQKTTPNSEVTIRSSEFAVVLSIFIKSMKLKKLRFDPEDWLTEKQCHTRFIKESNLY